MRKQKGSAAVMALIFMLFLSLAGGAWVTMLAHENATAMNDEKDQQAWYAAEAGMKRAKAELIDNSNSKEDWKSWLTADKTFSSNSKKIAVATGKTPRDTESDKAQYAVYIEDTTASTSVATAGMGTSGDSYEIISVGYYMDSTKIISVEDFTPVSGGGGGGGDDDKIKIKPLPDNSIISAKAIDVSGMGGPSNLKSGELYGTSITGQGTKDWNTFPYNEEEDTYVDSLYTHIPESYFVAKSDAIANGAVKYLDVYGGNPQITFEANKSYYIDTSSVIDNKGNPNGNSIQKLDFSNASGAIVYVYDNMWTKLQSISGPTADGAVPVTVIIVNTSESVLNVNTYGRVRILAESDLTFSGSSKKGKFMAMTNGNMILQGQAISNAFICADGNVLVSGGSFTGQIMAKGTVTMVGLAATLDNTISQDTSFWLKEWELSS